MFYSITNTGSTFRGQVRVRGKLDKLYSSFETGKLDIDNLAPRIKELKNQVNTLETKRNKIIEEVKIPNNLPFSANSLKS